MKQDSPERKLTTAQRNAIEALLTNGTLTAAASAAGVHRSTLYKWQADKLFVEALREAEAEAVAGLARSLAGLGEAAADALRAALAADQKPSIRLRASEIVIGNLLRLRELVELEARIAALEAKE